MTVDNSSGLLKPGMFATASIDSGKDSSARKVIAVPEEAVFLDGSERYVFVQEGDERFVARRVSVGPRLRAEDRDQGGAESGRHGGHQGCLHAQIGAQEGNAPG